MSHLLLQRLSAALGRSCSSAGTQSQPWQGTAEEEGAEIATAWLYAFSYPSADQRDVALKTNKRKREGLAGLPALCLPAGQGAGSRQQGSDVTQETGSRSDWQSGACSVGVRGDQPCESPLAHPRHV